MAKRAYISNRWPALKIGRNIAFQNGLYETADPEEQALIESRDYYKVHVHPRDPEESEIVSTPDIEVKEEDQGPIEEVQAEEEAPRDTVPEETAPRIRVGRKGSK